jgi:tetratricopeptide (TPR) repeat protein
MLRRSLIVAILLAPSCATTRHEEIDARFEDAERARVEGRDDDALSGLRYVLAQQPDHFKANESYQNLLESDDKHDQLVQEYSALVERWNEPWCYYFYARLLHDPVREEELCRKGLRLDAKDVHLRTRLASALARERLNDAALAEYEAVLCDRPDDRDVFLAQIVVLKRTDHLARRVKELEARADTENSARAHFFCAMAQLHSGDPEGGHEHLKKAHELAPHDVHVLEGFCTYYLAAQHTDDLVAAADELLELAPHDADVLSGWGLVHAVLCHEDRGVTAVRQAVRLNPFNATACRSLGLCELVRAEYALAKIHLARAVQLDPTDVAAHCALGAASTMTQDMDRAVAEYELATDIDPTSDVQWQELGGAYQRAGRHADAKRAYERSAAIRRTGHRDLGGTVAVETSALVDPRELESWSEAARGSELIRLGQLTDAVSALRRAIELKPDNYVALWSLACACHEIGDDEAARDAFERSAAASVPHGPSAWAAVCWIRAADCLYRMGRRDEAVERYRSIQHDYPGLVPTVEALGDIVRALDASPADAEEVKIPDVGIERSGVDDTCYPIALTAVLKHWHVAVALADVVDYMTVKHRPHHGVALKYLQQLPEVAAIEFTPDRDSMKALLRKGYPVILTRTVLYRGEAFGHASVAIGFDERRGVFLLEDSNWAVGGEHISYSQIESCQALLIGPKDRVLLDGKSLPDQEYWKLVCQAELALLSGEFADAQRSQQAALELKRDDPFLYSMLAEVCMRRQEFDSAVRWCLEGTRCQRQSPWIWKSLGDLRVRDHAYRDAEYAYRHAIELEPNYTMARVALASVHAEALWDRERCLSETKELVERPDWNARAFLVRGVVLYRAGEHEEAERALRTAMAWGVGRDAQWYLAFNYAARKKFDDAIAALEQCRAQVPSSQGDALANIDRSLDEWRKSASEVKAAPAHDAH